MQFKMDRDTQTHSALYKDLSLLTQLCESAVLHSTEIDYTSDLVQSLEFMLCSQNHNNSCSANMSKLNFCCCVPLCIRMRDIHLIYINLKKNVSKT